MELFEDLQATVRNRIEQKPYTSVLVALAAGYVLGGGVPWWAVKTAANVGGRVLVSRAIASIVDPQ